MKRESVHSHKNLTIFSLKFQAGHIYICDFHKSVIQNMRMKRRRKDSEECDSGETDTEHPEVDLFQLQVNTLRRYKKHYKVPVRQGLNKAQLADVSLSKISERNTLFQIFIFCPKLQLWFPEKKLSIFWGEKLLKMLRFWTL